MQPETEGGNKSYRWIIWLGIGIIFVVLAAGGVFLILHAHRSQTISTTDDAFISSNNLGGSTNTGSLEVSNNDAECSTTTNCATYSRQIYLKFKVSNLPSDKKIKAVNLRLFATNLSGDGGQIYVAKDNNWNENSLTWSNAPQAIGRAVGSIGPVLKFGELNISLPPDIIKANSEVTLIIKNNDRNIAAYKSSETGKDGPALVLEFGNTKLAAQANKSFTLLAGGDISCGSDSFKVDDSDCKQSETAQLIGSEKPDAVLVLGDVQYDDGKLKDFNDYFNPTWGQYKSILKPAAGNHEYNNSYNNDSNGCSTSIANSPFAYACGYFDYFNGINKLSGQAGERGKGFYAFSLGNWRIYALNSNCTIVACQAGSEQEHWFRTDLAQHPNSCKLMFEHHPITASDPRNFDAYLAGVPDPTNYTFLKLNQTGLSDLYQAFYDYGGDLALVGHSHFYERFAPQNINRQPDAKGYQEIVVGTGGRYTYDIDSKHVRPLSLVHSNRGDHGLLQLNLEASSYAWKFMPTPDTKFVDQGASTCHIDQQ